MSFEKREGGEVALPPFDPADSDGPRMTFIGRIRSRWQPGGDAPRNIGSAREAGAAGTVELEPGYAQGLQGLEVGRHVIVMYWMDRARRDLIVQSPRHTASGRGVFSLRSPVRPNPIAMSTVKITSLDMETGVIGIDAIDCFDGTPPVVDIKPWIETIDMPQG